MKRSDADKEKLTGLLQKLFGAWARTATKDELLGYAAGLRGLSLAQIGGAIDRAIDAGGPFPPSAAAVKALVEFDNHEDPPAECQLCRGSGFQIITRGHAKLAERCPCRGRYVPTAGVKTEWWAKLLDGTDRRLREMERA